MEHRSVWATLYIFGSIQISQLRDTDVGKQRLPAISDEALLELASRIRPVARFVLRKIPPKRELPLRLKPIFLSAWMYQQAEEPERGPVSFDALVLLDRSRPDARAKVWMVGVPSPSITAESIQEAWNLVESGQYPLEYLAREETVRSWRDEDDLFYISTIDRSGCDITIELSTEAQCRNWFEFPRPKEPAWNLKRLTTIETIHEARGGSFNPRLTEVFAQIPETSRDKTVAFEILRGRQKLTAVVTEDFASFDNWMAAASYYTGETVLYTSVSG